MESDDSLFDSSLSPRRKRQRSPSHSPSSGSDDAEASSRQRRRHDDLSVEVCKDFIRSACRRAETDCKFAHPHSAVTIKRDKVMACADSLRNRCFRGRTCRYFHPPPQIQESLLKAIGMEDTKVPMVCRDFIRGRCLRAAKECRFAHPSSIDECAMVCQAFLHGKCERKSCRFSHALVHSVPQALQYFGAAVKLPSYPQPGNDQESIPVCRDFLKNACNRDSCKYDHPDSHAMALQYFGAAVKLPSYPQPGNDQESIPVCRDFLKNACNRDSCKYDHPDSHAMVYLQHPGLPVKLHSSTLLENGATPNATLLFADHDTVPVCRDFLKNACNRDSCKYFHLIPQPEAYLQQHGSLAKLPSSPHRPETEQESLPVCRDFLKNACQRDPCKYAHPNSQTKVIDNQVEICRDFRRGLCHRAICRFYHPHTRSAEK